MIALVSLHYLFQFLPGCHRLLHLSHMPIVIIQNFVKSLQKLSEIFNINLTPKNYVLKGEINMQFDANCEMYVNSHNSLL